MIKFPKLALYKAFKAYRRLMSYVHIVFLNNVNSCNIAAVLHTQVLQFPNIVTSLRKGGGSKLNHVYIDPFSEYENL